MTIGVVERERIDVEGSALFHNWVLRHVTVGDLRCFRNRSIKPCFETLAMRACMRAFHLW